MPPPSVVSSRSNSPRPGRRSRVAAAYRRGTKLAIVSTYPPRRCGLATFARDVREALVGVATDLEVSICAIDADGFTYPPEVEVVVAADDPTSYRRAAAQLRQRGTDVVLIEHEYGIFGGEHGAFILGLAAELRRLGVPYLVTPHTLLSRPSATQASVLAALCRNAAAVAVLTPTAVRLAVEARIAGPDRLVVTPHGAPPALRGDVDPGAVRPALAAALAEARGRRLLSTFGLLGPGKAIETALAALEHVVREHPDVCYVVAGATHPGELRHHGETYRRHLFDRVRAHGLGQHVRFVDDFLALSDLAALLGRTEIYLTPYRSREQISSGTLAFALAAGCPAVSTDYHYARDMLGQGAGALVPVDDADALADALRRLLSDGAALASTRAVADRLGARLLWPAVARQVAELVRSVAASARRNQPGGWVTKYSSTSSSPAVASATHVSAAP